MQVEAGDQVPQDEVHCHDTEVHANAELQ
jgi:hypothetical protein